MDEGLLKRDVDQADDGWLRRVAKEARATAVASVLTAEQKEQAECFRWQINDLQAKLAKLLNVAAAPIPSQPTNCVELATKLPTNSLLVQAQAAAEQGEERLTAERKAASALFNSLATDVNTELDPLRASIEASMSGQAGAPLQELQDMLAAVNALGSSALEAIRRAEAIFQTALDRATEIRDDKAEQGKIFADFVQRLEKAGGPFQPLRDNPKAVADAAALDMKYRDRFQLYAFGPWTGAPTRIDEPSFELKPSMLVPILDVFGMRWQWGTRAYQEIRFIPIGVMYFTEDAVVENADGDEEEVTKSHWALQGNLSVSTFRAGFAWVADEEGKGQQRWRIVLGADVWKIVTGGNLEAF